MLLKTAGFRTLKAQTPGEALSLAGRGRPDLVVMDLNYSKDTISGREGMELLAELQRLDPHLPVVVMTAWGTMELAVEAMRRGARDFILKPWDNPSILATIGRLASTARESTGLREDLDIARNVQKNLFPGGNGRAPGLEYAACCHEAGAVGGDYYDFLELNQGQRGFIVADVCGKGIPAALLMANLQATIRSLAAVSFPALSLMLHAANRLFLESTEPGHFATLFLACWDGKCRQLRYVNCGHNPPLLLRAGGESSWLEATATVFGILPDWTCQESLLELNPGDLLVIYSDGLVEAGRDRGEEFGENRLLEELLLCRKLPALQIPGRLIEAARKWGGPRQEDDLTVMVLRMDDSA